jgi:hypothetical protein
VGEREVRYPWHGYSLGLWSGKGISDRRRRGWGGLRPWCALRAKVPRDNWAVRARLDRLWGEALRHPKPSLRG